MTDAEGTADGPAPTGGPTPTDGPAPTKGTATDASGTAEGPVLTEGTVPTGSLALTRGASPTGRPVSTDRPASTDGPAPTGGAAPTGGTSATRSGGLRLADPNTFAEGVPHGALAELRATTPVAWQEMDGQPGFWAVLRHADVVTVARDPERFSAERGGVVLEDLPPESLEMMRGMLLAMDPPRHVTYRKPLADTFRAKVIADLEPQIRDICRDLMAEAAEAGPEVEFVHQVTAGLPTRVMGRLMGLPEADWALLHELSERQTAGQDPDINPPGPDGAEADFSASIDMAMYAIEFAARRRTEEPREDLTTLILDGDFGGQPMSDGDFGSFFVQLVTAGNDTTKTMLSSGLLALLQHPDQLAAVRADRTLVPGAVEEILRWANPLHYFRRTATVDTELAGQAIAAGDKVAMYYTSANRDEAVFDDPQRFDITRTHNPHLSFGIAEHFCLGVHLARLEGRVFFEELLAAFPAIELAGEPVRLRSNLNNSFKRLPVRLGGYRGDGHRSGGSGAVASGSSGNHGGGGAGGDRSGGVGDNGLPGSGSHG